MNLVETRPLAPTLMKAILPALNDPEVVRAVKTRQSIPAAQIMAQAWHRGRLQDCLHRLQAGETFPPVDVNRYYLYGAAYYTINDGNHRIVAAQQLGIEAIAAYVRCEGVCQPQDYMVDVKRRTLWRKALDDWHGPVLKVVLFNLEQELLAAFQQVGVKQLT